MDLFCNEFYYLAQWKAILILALRSKVFWIFLDWCCPLQFHMLCCQWCQQVITCHWKWSLLPWQQHNFQVKPDDKTFIAPCSTNNHSITMFIDNFFFQNSPSCFLPSLSQKTNANHGMLAHIFRHLMVDTCIHNMFLLVHWIAQRNLHVGVFNSLK